MKVSEKMDTKLNETAREWAEALCFYAGEDKNFLEQFWSALQESEQVYRFFFHFEHRVECH